MGNVILVAVIFIILGAAIAYIVKEKKKGVRCIGCPAAGTCTSMNHTASGCGCGCNSNK